MTKIPITLFSLFSLLYLITSQTYNFYPKDTIFKFMNKLNSTSDELKTIIEDLCDTFKELYAFNEISKNPPKYKGKDFFNKVNIQEELKKIDTNNTNLFKFYQEIRKVIFSLEDFHIILFPELNSKFNFLTEIRFADPLYFRIKEFNGEPRVFGELRADTDLINNFKDSEKLKQIIEENSKFPIKSINGINPFLFILTFGGDNQKLKSQQGTFKHKFVFHNNSTYLNFFLFPLSSDYFTDYTVVYENNQTFTTEYIFYSEKKLDENNLKSNLLNSNSNLFFKNNNLYYNIFKGINNNNLKEKKIEWDYDYNEMISCKFDKMNEINLIKITSFMPDDLAPYSQTLLSCLDLFDSNAFPIILLLDYNTGGYYFYTHYILELISPNIAFNLYGAIRNYKILKDKNKNFTETFYNNINKLDNCEIGDFDTLNKNPNEIDYGNNIKDILSNTFYLLQKPYRNQINEFKKILKNPRKPTDVLLLTDGFSFSSGSIVTKSMQYFGGGITVGYFPNPIIDFEKNPFDSGLSPSAAIMDQQIYEFDPKGYKDLVDN